MTAPTASRPTLIEVARVAGVSVGLASMCLTGAPGPADKTREHVREIAERLGYRPDKAASLLARNRIRRVGVVFALRQAFHAHVIEKLYQASAAQGYELLLSAVTADRPARLAAEHLLDSRCQAIILISSRADAEAVDTVAGQVPVVVIGSGRANAAVSSIRVDGRSGVRQAMAYLRSAGHRRIAFVEAPGAPGTIDRRAAYEAAMSEADDAACRHIISGGETLESGMRAAAELLRLPELPTAVVAYNDECAAGVIFGLKIRGTQVPAQVSVIGFDDSGFAWQSGLAMTTLHQDVAQIATRAMTEATRLIEDGDAPITPAKITITPELRIRDSSGPSPTAAIAG